MINSLLKFTIPALVLVAGLFVSTTNSYATLDMSKKEKKGCSFCHAAGTKPTKDSLNDVGKCYQKDHSLATCAPKS